MKFLKKGQAATEFLMTYGWAILVVIVAIAALAYFGVLSPDRFLPNKCTVDPGFACLDWKISDTTQLVLKNSIGEDLTNVNITIEACNDTFEKGSWVNGEEFTASLNDCTVTAGGKVNWDINYTYAKASGLSHIGTGQIIAKAE